MKHRNPVATALATLLVMLAMMVGSPPSGAEEAKDDKAAAKAESPPMWNGGISEEEFKALHQAPKDAAVDLQGTMVDLAGGKAYLTLPFEGQPPFPALIVIQEWWGLNDHMKHWADRLAAEGYAALAVDLYEGQVATDSDTAVKLMKGVNEEKAMKTLKAAHTFLKTDERVNASKTGAIGWCFGGGWSLRTAIAEPDLDAAVIYYGHLIDDPQKLMQIHAHVCGVFGNLDKGIPPEAVDAFDAALTKATVDHEIYRYEAEHAFANPSNPIYDEKNAAEAWKKVRDFLKRTLKK